MRNIRRLLVALTAGLVSSLVLVTTNSSSPTANAAGGPPPELVSASGYTMAAADGGVFTYGNSKFHGSAGNLRLNAPVIDMAMTSDGGGYWLAGRDGGIFSYGNAKFFGSTGSIRLNQPVVSMASKWSDNGYWFAASDGGVFAFGDAGFFGSMGGKKLNSPVVSMAVTPSGNGYWLVASDGGIFAFGDAAFKGSMGGKKLNSPIVSMVPTEGGQGYWLVAADGGVFSFGDANFYGSAGSIRLNKPIVDIARTPSSGGYWLVASDGGVFTYGDATFMGSASNASRANVTSISTPPRKRTAETSIFYYPWWSTADHDGAWRHWDQGGNTPPDYIGADYWPSRGPYSSADPTIVAEHMAEIKAAGIDTVVVSWWGKGSWEDSTLGGLIAAANSNNLRVAAHIEPYSGRSINLESDYKYFLDLGITEFYVYNADSLNQAAFKKANDSLPSSSRVWAQAAALSSMKNGKFQIWAKNAGVTGIYTYAGFGFSAADFGAVCDYAHALKLLCSPSVAPGFTGLRATSLKIVADRGNGATYDSQWAGAIANGSDVISITSYNEWHEGTQIEPAVPHCMPDTTCMKNYAGHYGSSGNGANVYMERTKMWTNIYKSRFPSAF